MLLSPLVPLLDPLLEDFEMFRVRHCRVTSLASGMLRMILPGPQLAPLLCELGWFEGHTLCDRPRPVNARAFRLAGPRGAQVMGRGQGWNRQRASPTGRN